MGICGALGEREGCVAGAAWCTARSVLYCRASRECTANLPLPANVKLFKYYGKQIVYQKLTTLLIMVSSYLSVKSF